MVDVVDSKSTAGDSVPVRVRSPAPVKERDLLISLFYLLLGNRTRTQFNAICRRHIAATSSKTGGYLNFLPGRKCKSSPVTGTIRKSPKFFVFEEFWVFFLPEVILSPLYDSCNSTIFLQLFHLSPFSSPPIIC